MELSLRAQSQAPLLAVYDLLDADHPTLCETPAWRPGLGSCTFAGLKCEAVAACLACMMHPHSLLRLCQRGLSAAGLAAFHRSPSELKLRALCQLWAACWILLILHTLQEIIALQKDPAPAPVGYLKM